MFSLLALDITVLASNLRVQLVISGWQKKELFDKICFFLSANVNLDLILLADRLPPDWKLI